MKLTAYLKELRQMEFVKPQSCLKAGMGKDAMTRSLDEEKAPVRD